ncbi:MAG: ArnT family glycosyltransferase [Trinickia sp.]|jgi:4-amino-4-deoxy-L-arabinose transferase-like glycosyltransferase|uniref:ArnT family glycosyltransferase n=1 Tax=Trinickia sp. TaxID=2571163 RepID=UPI003F7DCD1C
MRPVVRLTASATRALPRWLLLTLCIVYAAFGLFGRDPWKNEDAAGFGVMWTMAGGNAHDWLLPNLVGKFITDDGPFGYWLGAISIRALAPWVDAADASRLATGLLFCATCAFVWYAAYLLGRRAEVQPFKYAFGGEPEPRDFGRMLADGALLILVACFGLAERGHETTPQLSQLMSISMLAYGLVRSADKPLQGTLWWALALGLLALSGNPLLVTVLLASTLTMVIVVPELRSLWLPLAGVPLALALSLAWPLIVLHAYPDDAHWFIEQWINGSINRFTAPSGHVWLYALKNLPLFTWPAWPLALWAWASWGGMRRKPHIAIPVSVALPLLLLAVLQSHNTNRLYMLLLPPLATLAAFALPTLKRGAINAIDWFAVLSFSILGIFVWLVWLASETGIPHQLAHNLARLVPGFVPHFSILSFVCAVAATVCWLALVRWRIARHPKVLWRSVVLSSAGTTLMWVLLMTLWLPMVNYSRTYRDVAMQIAEHLPNDYTCISPVRLGDAQLASFAYFADMQFSFNQDCDVLLRQDSADFSAPSPMLNYAWKLVWEGRRAADRDERFRLYVRVDRPQPKVEPHRRLVRKRHS